MSSAWRSLRLKRAISAGLGSSALADDADHLVDVQQHQLPAFQHMDAVQHLVQPVLACARHGLLAEVDPLASIWRRLFCTGRPSAPTIVRLIGALVSRLVCASSG
jgi:hypothetical protein